MVGRDSEVIIFPQNVRTRIITQSAIYRIMIYFFVISGVVLHYAWHRTITDNFEVSSSDEKH